MDHIIMLSKAETLRQETEWKIRSKSLSERGKSYSETELQRRPTRTKSYSEQAGAHCGLFMVGDTDLATSFVSRVLKDLENEPNGTYVEFVVPCL